MNIAARRPVSDGTLVRLYHRRCDAAYRRHTPGVNRLLIARPFVLSVYQRLLGRYGPQQWWPAESPFEVVVGAILTQSTAWQNVARAIANLKAAAVLSPQALLALPEEELAALIRPSGYFRAKARKLRAFLAVLADEYEGDLDRLFALSTPVLRERLLAIYGIGPETADSIALYAGGHPLFVVDAYTRRVFERLGLADERVTYAELQRLFSENLPLDVCLYNEYHALIVRHGKYVCRTQPRCGDCVLLAICPTGRRNVEQSPDNKTDEARV
jgi:endonuclease III related protein